MAIKMHRDFRSPQLEFTTLYNGVCISRGRWIRTTGLLHPYGFEARTQNPPGSSTLAVQDNNFIYITQKYSQKPYRNKKPTLISKFIVQI